VKADQTFEAKGKARDLINKMASLGKEKGLAELNRAQANGEITPMMAKQIVRIMQKKGSVAAQKKEFYQWFDKMTNGGK